MKIDGFHFVSLDFSLSFSPPSTFPLLFLSPLPFLCRPLTPSASPNLLFLLDHVSPTVSSSVSFRLQTPSLINSASTMSQ